MWFKVKQTQWVVRWCNHTGCQATDGFLPHWLTHLQPSWGLKNGHLWRKRDSNGALKHTLYPPLGTKQPSFFQTLLHYITATELSNGCRWHNRSLLNVAPLTTAPPLCCTDILSVSCLYTWNNSGKQQLSRDLAVETLQNCSLGRRITYSRQGVRMAPVSLCGLGVPKKECDVTSWGQLQQQQQSKQTESGGRYRREDYELPVNLFSGLKDHRDVDPCAFPTVWWQKLPVRTGCTGCCEVLGPGGEPTRLRSGYQLEE